MDAQTADQINVSHSIQKQQGGSISGWDSRSANIPETNVNAAGYRISGCPVTQRFAGLSQDIKTAEYGRDRDRMIVAYYLLQKQRMLAC